VRKPLLLAAAALFGACATATVAVKPGFDFRRVKRVAVIGFSDYSNQFGSGETLSGAFEQGLLAAGWNVVERAQVDKILRERKLTADDPKAAKALGRILNVDALLFGRITDFRAPVETLTEADVVDTHQDPVYVKKTKRAQNADGTWTNNEETVLQGYRTTRVIRREPRTLTVDGRLGVTVRLVFVPTGEVLWSGSDVTRVWTFEDSARGLADSILKAVKPTWPSELK
jgi:hypothetical protein